MNNELELVKDARALREWMETPNVAQKILAVAAGNTKVVERVTAMACLAVAQTPKLAECDRLSVLDTMMRATELGVTIGDPIRGEAYPVPFKGRCTLMLGYRGLQKLIRRGGEVKEIYSHPVYKHDQFSYELGDSPRVVHVPDWKTPHRDADIVAFYAVAKWTHGGFEVCVMQRGEVDAILEGVKRKNGGKTPDPWLYAFAETAKKCPIRRIAKQLPMTSEAERVLHESEEAEMGDDETPRPKPEDALVASSTRAALPASVQVIDSIESKLPPINADEIDAAADSRLFAGGKP